ncbi:hypothetical protein GCM10012275_38210 [Longimycelium tulufanense]|uniref:Gp28/Gp37-like domain-containing protein n=1 Tax=Longimycelium tulufanense TaxID=907463 RepID=A0A8J3FWZ3_9PSEU|nr:siphovirus ReqiPepy6 Gp37-like family protein [Longimycelium tulufanense]GGM64043.1 hypothetical protein GCM10012275_38210 [Longimycelium tulufanense]
MAEWLIYVRDADRNRVALVEDYQTLTLIRRFNAVGTWELDIDQRTAPASQLATAGYGIEVVRDDGSTLTTVLSGPVDHRARVRDLRRNRLRLTGVDDMVWLARRLAHPEPATSSPPYNTNAYDVRTGTASTILRQYVDVNAGPGALTPRQVDGLTLAADPAVGSSVTGRARWQNLLELLQKLALAGGDLGFQVVQSGTDLEFSVYQPEDKTGTVHFSEDLGNLVGFSYEVRGPKASYIYVGGGGEGTARTIREGQDSTDVATWGRNETFVDRRDTTDTGELDQEITETLDTSGVETRLELEPIDLDGQTYLTHYDLGDKVTVVVDGVTITDIVRAVRIELTPEGPQKVMPDITTPDPTDVLGLFRRLAAAEGRISNLERR